MSPIFKCLICRKDIERSTKSFWNKKGHLLCSTCLDQMDKKLMKEYSSNINFAVAEIMGILKYFMVIVRHFKARKSDQITY